MPYKRVGAHKISDHHVRSPLLNVQKACQTCHHWPEEELKARATAIQERTFKMRNLAMDALMDLIDDLKGAKTSGISTNDPALVTDRTSSGKPNSSSISLRPKTRWDSTPRRSRCEIPAESIDFSRRGQNAVRALVKAGK